MANLQLCEARPDQSGALFVSLGEALAQKSGNGGRIKAPKYYLILGFCFSAFSNFSSNLLNFLKL